MLQFLCCRIEFRDNLGLTEQTYPSSVRDDSQTSESTMDCKCAGTSVAFMPRVNWRSSGYKSVFWWDIYELIRRTERGEKQTLTRFQDW